MESSMIMIKVSQTYNYYAPSIEIIISQNENSFRIKSIVKFITFVPYLFIYFSIALLFLISDSWYAQMCIYGIELCETLRACKVSFLFAFTTKNINLTLNVVLNVSLQAQQQYFLTPERINCSCSYEYILFVK